MQSNRFTALHLEDLAEQAERFALMRYERLPKTLVLHNDSWALALAGHAKEIAMRRPGASPELPSLCTILGLLEACRYWGVAGTHYSLEQIIQDFREWTGPDYLQLQLSLLALTEGRSGTLHRESTDVLYDAQLAQRLLSGTEGAELAWLEERYHRNPPPERGAYLRSYLQELREARFRDGELRRRYQHTHSAVLLDLQRLVDDLEARATPERLTATSLATVERGPTRQVSQTYFKTVFHNHLQMSLIADRKAAMMISLNAVMIGVNVTFISYRNWVETKPEVLLPVSAFVVCALASIIFAIIASRPGRRGGENYNLADFEAYDSFSEEEFREQTQKMLLDPQKLYATLIGHLRQLGLGLDRRYGLLRYSYTLFLVGMVLSALLTLGILLF